MAFFGASVAFSRDCVTASKCVVVSVAFAGDGRLVSLVYVASMSVSLVCVAGKSVSLVFLCLSVEVTFVSISLSLVFGGGCVAFTVENLSVSVVGVGV